MSEVMSTYEARAWSAMRDAERKRRESATTRAGEKLDEFTHGVEKRVRKSQIASAVLDLADETIVKGFEGAALAVLLPSIQTVSFDKRVARLGSKHAGIAGDRLFVDLDLAQIDKGRPTVRVPLLGAAESLGASVLITYAQLNKDMDPDKKVKLVLGAVTADVAASLAFIGRALAEVAVHYGYDPTLPEEELFLLGVLNYNMASSTVSKTAALASLSRLSGQITRKATWEQLNREPLVRLINRVFAALGFRLTKERLANVVPVAGGVVTAGLGFRTLRWAIEDATRLYRARYLAEKYGLSWEEWVAGDPIGDVEPTVLAIDQLLDEAAPDGP
jgi:hypothetical protein